MRRWTEALIAHAGTHGHGAPDQEEMIGGVGGPWGQPPDRVDPPLGTTSPARFPASSRVMPHLWRWTSVLLAVYP